MDAPLILVADDSPVVLRMIEGLLTEAGLAVATARDGIEALEKAHGLPVRLVILDVTMPRLNGYQACRLLKAEPATRHLPVIILTSRDQAGDRFWGLETGADYYLTKDSEPRRLADLVRNVLAAEPPRPSQPAAAPVASLDLISRVNELLDRKLYEATLLSEIGRVGRDLGHFDQCFTSVMSLVARAADFSLGGLAFVEDDELEVLLAVQRPVSTELVEAAKRRLLELVAAERRGQGFARVQARLFRPSTLSGPEEGALTGFVAVPVRTERRLSGVLALAGKSVARLGPEDQPFLEKVANQALIVTENARLVERLRTLSIRDSLTGLYNHRHSMEALQRESERVRRYAGRVGVLMVDVDHFKRINDELGHPAGDGVLKEIASRLRDGLRAVDVLGRYGGEEFVAILPETGLADARHTAERLRHAVGARPVRVGETEVAVTISVGCASQPGPGVDSPSELVAAADSALYRAKQGGRNRVE